MPVRINRIAIGGFQEQINRLSRIERGIASFRMFFEERAKPLLIEEVEAIFAREGISPRWKPLAASTVAQKRREGLDNGILRRTGKLYRAYTGGSGASISISDTRFAYDVSVPYAIYHEDGTSRIPQRQVFGQVVRSKTFQRNLIIAAERYVQRIADRGR